MMAKAMISMEWANKVNTRVEELVRQKEKGELQVIPKITITPPFMRKIMEEPFPTNFKATSIQRFNRVRDPQEHDMAYQIIMVLLGDSDKLMHKALFSISRNPFHVRGS